MIFFQRQITDTLGYHHMKIKRLPESCSDGAEVKEISTCTEFMHSDNSLAFVDIDYEGTKKILYC